MPIERSKNGGLAGVTLVRRAGGLTGVVSPILALEFLACTSEILPRVSLDCNP